MERENIRELLTITERTMRNIHCRQNLGNVPRREFFVMNVIDEYCSDHPDLKGISVTKISKIIDAAAANTSKLLRIMEDKGYIIRNADESDRRTVYICLSPQGKEIISAAKDDTEKRFEDIFDKMGEKDFLEYLRLSRKLYKILQCK